MISLICSEFVFIDGFFISRATLFALQPKMAKDCISANCRSLLKHAGPHLLNYPRLLSLSEITEARRDMKSTISFLEDFQMTDGEDWRLGMDREAKNDKKRKRQSE